MQAARLVSINASERCAVIHTGHEFMVMETNERQTHELEQRVGECLSFTLKNTKNRECPEAYLLLKTHAHHPRHTHGGRTTCRLAKLRSIGTAGRSRSSNAPWAALGIPGT